MKYYPAQHVGRDPYPIGSRVETRPTHKQWIALHQRFQTMVRGHGITTANLRAGPFGYRKSLFAAFGVTTIHECFPSRNPLQ